MATLLEHRSDSEDAQTRVRCGCGRVVYCFEFTNECDCGTLYNFAGQELKPVDQWAQDW